MTVPSAAFRLVAPKYSPGVIPGTRSALAVTLIYISLLVVIPLSALVIRSAGLGWDGFVRAAFSERALAAYKLSFGASLIAAAINAVMGLVIAWVLVRDEFPGKRIVDAAIDIPFALPTAVAGVALTTLYSPNGWLGSLFAERELAIAFAWPGVVIALTFVGLPFTVRAVQPVLADFPAEIEEAATTLGATPWQTFIRVLLPSLLPATLTGFALAFARALGEYGSIAFISGNMPGKTEVGPLLIMTKLEQYDYAGATSIAVVMLTASLVILGIVNALQQKAARTGRN